MFATLVMFRSDGTRQDFSIKPGKRYVIGRKDNADLRIPLASVSREHAAIFFDEEEDELVIEDLGSSNGTTVNGEKSKRCELSPGDVILVGDVPLQVVIDGHPADVQPISVSKPRPAEPAAADSQTMSGRAATAPPPAAKDPAEGASRSKKKGDSEDDSFLDLVFGDDEPKT